MTERTRPVRRIAVASTIASALALPVAAQMHDHSQMQAAPEPAAQLDASAPVLRLDELETRAIATSPAVLAADARVKAAEGRARQAGLYPNPTAGYSGEEIRTGPYTRGGQHGVFVEQTIVLGGKLGRRKDVLEQEVVAARAELDAATLAARTGVRLAYFEAFAAQQRVTLLERLAALVEEAVRTSNGLYNVGQADRPDVLEIEIESRRAQLDLARARSGLALARRQLGLLVGDESAAAGRFDGRIEDALPAVEAGALDTIIATSPALAAARADVARAEAEVKSAKAERVPDLFVRGGAQYNRELLEATNRPVGWQGVAEVGVGIPIFDRNQGAIAAAEAGVVAATSDVKLRELEIRTRFADALRAYQDALRTSDAYRNEIIPKAEEAYRLYNEKYQMMTAAYPQVLIARRTLLQVNLDYLDALEELARAAVPIRGLLVDASDATSVRAGSGSDRVDLAR